MSIASGSSVVVGDAEPNSTAVTKVASDDGDSRTDFALYTSSPRVAVNITLDLSIASGGSFHADRRGFRGGDSGGVQSNEAGGSLANYSKLLVTSLGKGSPAARGDGAGESAASGGGGGGYGGE